MTSTQTLPPLHMRGAFEPSTVDRKARTVEVTFTTGARVLRGFWEKFWEELSLDPKHVHLERLQSGAPFLMDHNSWSVADTPGVIERAWLTKADDGSPVGRALVRFVKEGTDPEADKLWNKIEQGIVCNCSVGYRIEEMEKIEDGEGKIPVYRAVSWTPHEVSAVAIGADDGAGFRSGSGRNAEHNTVTIRGMTPHTSGKGITMDGSNGNTTQDIQAERQRSADILKVCTTARVPELAADFIQRGLSLEQTRVAVLDALAERSDSTGPSATPSGVEVGAPSFGRGSSRGPDALVRDMAMGLASRAGAQVKMTDSAAQYTRLSMVDLARLCLEQRNMSPRLLSHAQIVRSAFQSTDLFPALLQEAGYRILLDGYAAYPNDIKKVARQTSAPNFRTLSALRLGEAPELLKVPENGEYKQGTMASAKESYKLETFGRIFGLTRQAIINDDLGAFADLVRAYGRAAAELEAKTLVGLLTGNPTMSDGQPLFSAAHGNLAAIGSAISVESLAQAFAAMRTAKNIGGREPLNIRPRFLVVPAALELAALQVTAQLNANTVGDVNPFGGQLRLEPVVDPRLDLHSTKAWYVAADPNVTPSLEYAYLDGANGPEVIEHDGFEVDGRQWKARMDYGAGVLGYIGLYKNPGDP